MERKFKYHQIWLKFNEDGDINYRYELDENYAVVSMPLFMFKPMLDNMTYKEMPDILTLLTTEVQYKQRSNNDPYGSGSYHTIPKLVTIDLKKIFGITFKHIESGAYDVKVYCYVDKMKANIQTYRITEDQYNVLMRSVFDMLDDTINIRNVVFE